jgi:hypothetical protein
MRSKSTLQALHNKGQSVDYGSSQNRLAANQSATAVTNQRQGHALPSSFHQLNRNESSETLQGNDILELINKVQMFQIACNKVNKSLAKRGLTPVFDLQVNSTQDSTGEAADLAGLNQERRHEDLY